MSFTVLPTASISATYNGAIPGVSYVRRGSTDMATFHLTRHSAAILANSMKNAAAASAIRISAICQLISDDPKDNPASSSLRFRFIQFFSLADQRAFYAGSTEADGQMYLDFARAPAFSGENELMLDSDSNSSNFPFYDMYSPRFQRVTPGLWMVTIVMDDHPFNDLPLAFPNSSSGKTNFLCTASKRFQVVTTVVCRDATDPAKPTRIMLGKISWGAEVACKIRWSKTGDNINPKTPEFTVREFYCSDPVQGADADLSAQIDKLDTNTPTFNDAAENAFKTIMGNGPVSLRNVQATEKWHSARVGDFFR
jgi:hypothetical protein